VAAQRETTHTARRRSGVERQAPRPTHIRIPAIGVSARIIPLGLAADGTMQTPRKFSDTGWYRPGPEPGERGPAVIAGHVDSRTGPAVFYKLGRLRRGDSIAITRANRSVIHFKVQGLERWPKASFPTKRVFGRTRGATLRLITCSGDFNRATGHYLDDTIVYAVRRTRQRPPS
jgi:sortase (surface protein transpeptidase)